MRYAEGRLPVLFRNSSRMFIVTPSVEGVAAVQNGALLLKSALCWSIDYLQGDLPLPCSFSPIGPLQCHGLASNFPPCGAIDFVRIINEVGDLHGSAWLCLGCGSAVLRDQLFMHRRGSDVTESAAGITPKQFVRVFQPRKRTDAE
jgi:hypothetical protein